MKLWYLLAVTGLAGFALGFQVAKSVKGKQADFWLADLKVSQQQTARALEAAAQLEKAFESMDRTNATNERTIALCFGTVHKYEAIMRGPRHELITGGAK